MSEIRRQTHFKFGKHDQIISDPDLGRMAELTSRLFGAKVGGVLASRWQGRG